ncbi:hypothetical protein ACB098_08G004700 [Castanea mollissima]
MFVSYESHLPRKGTRNHVTSLLETQIEFHLPSKVPKKEMGDTKKSDSPLPGSSLVRTARCPLPAMRSPSPFSRSFSPLLPSSNSPTGSSSPLCPLNNDPKFPMVDLVGKDLEVEEQEETEEEGEQEATNKDVDTTRKRKTTSDV